MLLCYKLAQCPVEPVSRRERESNRQCDKNTCQCNRNSTLLLTGIVINLLLCYGVVLDREAIVYRCFTRYRVNYITSIILILFPKYAIRLFCILGVTFVNINYTTFASTCWREWKRNVSSRHGCPADNPIWQTKWQTDRRTRIRTDGQIGATLNAHRQFLAGA